MNIVGVKDAEKRKLLRLASSLGSAVEAARVGKVLPSLLGTYHAQIILNGLSAMMSICDLTAAWHAFQEGIS